MATVSQNPNDPLAVAAWSDDGEMESKSERYLAKRLKAAGVDFKGVAVTTFLLAAAVGAVLWLACGIIVEHWLVPGGLPAWARWSWLTIGLAAFAAATVRWILPLVRYRVNLVYAARVIEREHPELHNDVVNAVLAQARADEAAPLIAKLLRRRAARQLSTVSADGIIDRTPALRLAYALAALIVLAVLYELIAPKSLLVSASRLMAPWLGIMAPSRVRIEAPVLSWRVPGGPAFADATQQSLPVVDGVAILVRGRQLVVSSGVHGLGAGEQPILLVTPLRDDGSVEPAATVWRVPMPTSGGKLHAAVLPDADRGLDHPVDLVIAAGDARSQRIRVAVVDAPSILVREVRYDYPDYTRQVDEVVPWQGDLRGVEGTQVTVVAECNHPLEAAWTDLGCDGKRDVPLAVAPQDLARARGTFTLRLDAERSAAEHASYRLLFQPKAASHGRREPAVTEKMEYRIEVIPDLAPEVSIEEPVEKVVRVPPDAPASILVRAVDPDFGLTSVSLETRLQPGGEKPGSELLVGRRAVKSWRGVATLIPADLGAGPGQVLEYRAVAKDNRPEAVNVTVTEWRKLTIDASAPPRQPPPAPAGGQRDRGGDGEPSTGSDDAGDPQQENGGGDERTGDEGGEQSGGEQSNDGNAQEQSEPQAGGQQSKGKSGESGREGEPQEQSRQQPDPKQGGKQGEPQQGEEQGAGEGAKSNDGAKGKAGNQPGQQQQQGSRDGAGNEPQGEGGTDGQGSGQGGAPKEGGQGGQQKPSGPGQQEGGGPGQSKPGAGGTGDQPGAGRPQKGQGRGEERGEQRDGGESSGEGQGQSRQQGKSEPKGTVAADGTDDGEAMERILQHREQSKGGESSSSSQQGQQGQGKQQGEGKQQGQDKQSRDGGPDDGSGNESTGGKPGQEPGKKSDQSAGNEPPATRDGSDAPSGQAEAGKGQQSADQSDGAGPQGQRQQRDGESGRSQGGQQPQQGGGKGQPQPGQQGETVAQGQPAGGEAGKGEAGAQSDSGQGQDGQAGQKQGQSQDTAAEGDGRQSGQEAGKGQGQTQGQGQGQRPSAGQEQGRQSAAGQGQDTGRGQDQGQSQESEQTAAGRPQGDAAAGQQPSAAKPGGEQPGGAQPSGAQPGGQHAPANGADPSPGSPTGGGGQVGGTKQRGGDSDQAAVRQDREMEWGEQDLAHARNAADLAIEHLRQSVESGDTGILDDLGWTPQQARDFLTRWEAMRRMARSGDQRQQGEFEQAIKSLGLRPGGVRSSRDVPTDVKGGQAEGRRSRPPSDYREQFKAFMQGAGVE
jgi:hypothetical protein